MKRHIRDNYFVIGEGVLAFDEDLQPQVQRPTDIAQLRKFRFSRLGPRGEALDDATRKALAEVMTVSGAQLDSAQPSIPAGFTYLAQFVDHDLTMDKTAKALGENVTLDELVQGRSPALDLDSVYGRGPDDAEDAKFYVDGIRLKSGRTAATPVGNANVDLDGFDLPRVGAGSTKRERRTALIPDERNDENLAVAQVHLAFIRFHNRVVEHLAARGTPGADLFSKARETVVKHYQWMLRSDFLPRIIDGAIVDDVFANGRKFFEVAPAQGDLPTMPIEFSVAAYRLGHSMIRDAYEWNRVFKTGGIVQASLLLLFTFSGTSGILSPDGDLNDPESGSFERLPTNWIADFRRLFDFAEANRPDLVPADGLTNKAKRIDSLLVDPLRQLPLGSLGGRGSNPPPMELNLAFRNLTRAVMVELASGQQMSDFLELPPLSSQQILTGSGGAVLDALPQAQKDALTQNTPLWFYILREAELNGGRLTGVGGRIVAEVFHRAMEGSAISIVRDPSWLPTLQTPRPDKATFSMVDLLLFAFDGKAELLNPLGD